MAGKWGNAALYQQHWPQDLRLNNAALPADLYQRVTTGSMSRSITQASTIQIVLENGDRSITSHWGANPFQSPTPNYGYGIPAGFTLVQVAKQADQVTITCEDAVINRLRRPPNTGTLAQAPGTRTRVDFAAQLCARAGVPFIADYKAAPLAAPVSRGGTNAPNEDSWTCLTRLASDVGWYCFSDGTSVLFGPQDWLLSWGGAPAMTIKERTDGVDVIDGSMDSGKPVSTLSVTARASLWQADPGAWVRVAPGMGPLSGDWIVSDINRQNLASDQIAVGLAAPTPVKPEPAAGGAANSATDPIVQVFYANVSGYVWGRLWALNYRPGRNGALPVPQSVLSNVEYGGF